MDGQFSKRARAWIGWFARNGLPAEHIAHILRLDRGAVSAWLNRESYYATASDLARVQGMHAAGLSLRAISRVTGHCRRTVTRLIREGRSAKPAVVRPQYRLKHHSRAPSDPAAMRGFNSPRARELRALGYTNKRIAHLLGVDLAEVRVLLRRPKLGVELASIDEADLWRYHDNIGPDGLPVAIVAPALDAVDQADADKPIEPPSVPNSWTGPTSCKATGEAHGRSKLTAADAREIRRLRAEGMSMYALARRYGVAENTIRGIVTGKTWKDA